MKITLKQIKPLSYGAAIVLSAAAGFLALNFLRENFYKTMIQSQAIKTLQRNSANDMVNFDKFEKVLEKNKARQADNPELEKTKNPF